MNIIWVTVISISIFLLLTGDISLFLPSVVNACKDSLTLCVSLCGIYCFWLGIFNILQESKVVDFISRLIKPLICKVYGTVSEVASQYIALNISANLLGVSNASTPSALSAIKEVTKDQDNSLPLTSRSPSRAVAMIFIVNATSIQLLPSTVISMRSSFSSLSPADITLPTLIATLVTTCIGICLTSLLYRNSTTNQKSNQGQKSNQKLSKLSKTASDSKKAQANNG
ncbi:MAG: nucleoside recognition domain-containing protein [Clostridia bacterium]